MEALKHLVAGLVRGIQFTPSRLIEVVFGVRDVQMVLRLPHFALGSIDRFEVDVRMSTSPTFGKDCRRGIR